MTALCVRRPGDWIDRLGRASGPAVSEGVCPSRTPAPSAPRRMRSHRAGLPPLARATLVLAAALLLLAFTSGALWWAWTEAACLVSLRAPLDLPLGDAAQGMWRAVEHGRLLSPQAAFPSARERTGAPEGWAYIASALTVLVMFGWSLTAARRRVRDWQAASPLAFAAGQSAGTGRAARVGAPADLGAEPGPAPPVGASAARAGGPTWVSSAHGADGSSRPSARSSRW